MSSRGVIVEMGRMSSQWDRLRHVPKDGIVVVMLIINKEELRLLYMRVVQGVTVGAMRIISNPYMKVDQGEKVAMGVTTSSI